MTHQLAVRGTRLLPEPASAHQANKACLPANATIWNPGSRLATRQPTAQREIHRQRHDELERPKGGWFGHAFQCIFRE